MTQLLSTLVMLALLILLLAVVILAVLAYRAKGSVAFLLLMLASIFYSLPHIFLVAIGLLFQVRGWPGSMPVWIRSWWYPVNLTFDVLFLGLFIGALVLFIRERRDIGTPHA
jgi:hypothetical protein